MNLQRAIFIGLGTVLFLAVGAVIYEKNTGFVRCRMDPNFSNIRQIQLGVDQFVLDRLSSDQNPFPPNLEALVPDYFSEKDFKKLTVRPITYTRPTAIPPQGTVYLTLDAPQGRIEVKWKEGIVVIPLRNKTI